MATMKIKEIREKQSEALRHELIERRKHLFDLRCQAVTEKLENPSLLRKTKLEIARIRTILRERELSESRAAGEAKA